MSRKTDVELARQELARRELARRHLLPFITQLKPHYKVGWFHRDLAARLERFALRVEREESPRMIINVPPRHGKSEQASRALPAWFLGRNPEKSIIATTHSDQLAIDNSRDVLEYMAHDRYRLLFDTELHKDAKGAAGWRTTAGGRYQPAGVGKGISGRGAHIFLIDDPHRDKDAYSAVVRDNIWRWYKSSARTRLAPGGGIIIIQTRWVLDDLTGRLMDEEGLIEDGGKWERICYPAEAMADEYRLPDGTIVYDETEGATLLRRKGEPLDPERYPLSELQQHKSDPVTWAALYQQNPVAEGAGTVTEELLAKCEVRSSDIPARLIYYATLDTAVAQTERSCRTAACTAGVDEEGSVWIVDARADRLDGLGIAEMIIDLYRQYDARVVGIERTNHSVAVAPFLDRYLEDNRIYDLEVVDLLHGNKDKVARARPMQALMRQGKVKIPADSAWYSELRDELLRFPAQPNDLADAFFYIGQLLDQMDSPPVPRVKQVQRNDKWGVARIPGKRKRKKSWRAA